MVKTFTIAQLEAFFKIYSKHNPDPLPAEKFVSIFREYLEDGLGMTLNGEPVKITIIE